MPGLDDLIDMISENALGITDKAFQAECRPLIKVWVLKKHKELINNKKSPFRNRLSVCKMTSCLFLLFLYFWVLVQFY